MLTPPRQPIFLRDARGKWLPGSRPLPGPGRPKLSAYLRATIEACTVEQWIEVVQRAYQDATNGDAKARGPAREFLRKAIFGDTPAVQLVSLLAQEGSAVAVNIGAGRAPQELVALLSDIVGFLARDGADETRQCA